MRLNSILVLQASLWIVVLPAGAASPGTAFTYHGHLTESGTPANGLYDLRFTLHDASSGGSAFGSPKYVLDTNVVDGLFVVTLDFGASAFTGPVRWLEVAVRPGSSLGPFSSFPRQALTPSPYALYSATAGSLDGLTANDIPRLDASQTFTAPTFFQEAVGIGTTAPSDLLHVTGVARAAEFAWGASRLNADQDGSIELGNSQGNGTTPFIDFHYGTGDNEDYNVRLINEVNGVLTLKGDFWLEGSAFVFDSLFVDVNALNSGTYAHALIFGGGGSGESIASKRTPGGNQFGLDFYSNFLPRMSILNNGRVGIGKTNPDTKLDVNGTVTALAVSSSGTNALDFLVNGDRMLRLAPGVTYPNILAGHNSSSTAFTGGSTIGGGAFNSVGGGYGQTIAGGFNNSSSGAAYTSIGGGSNNRADPDASFATVPGGLGAVAGHYGQWAYSSGSFATNSLAQTAIYVLRNQTSNNNGTELYLDGAFRRLTVPVGARWTFDIMIVASSDSETAGYNFTGAVKNVAAYAQLLPGSPHLVSQFEDDPSWTVVVHVNEFSDVLSITVYGDTVSPVRWVATVRTVELTLP